MEETQNEIATKNDWKNIPIDTPKKIMIELSFSEEQYNKIIKGLIPQQMEDKWFIFFENNWLYFHRSWTGFGIYKAEIIKNDKKYCINEFYVERNKEKYRTEEDDEDIDNFTFLIAWGLLKSTQAFLQKNINNGQEAVTAWGNFGSLILPTMYPTKENSISKEKLIIGAVAGDIIGSVFEWHNVKTTDFDLFCRKSTFTDDSVLTLATMDAIINQKSYAETYQLFGRNYPHRGYGGHFHSWIHSKNPEPYDSWGNGSAMRISPVGWYGDTIDEVMAEAQESAKVTHNHPEGIKGAQSTAVAIYMARTGKTKDEIKKFITDTFHYNLDRKIEDIRPIYEFDVSCQGSVPEAIIAFLESTDFENAIRLAISIGGDSDTIACITGGIAEAYYQTIPEYIIETILKILPEELVKIIEEFSIRYRK